MPCSLQNQWPLVQYGDISSAAGAALSGAALAPLSLPTSLCPALVTGHITLHWSLSAWYGIQSVICGRVLAMMDTAAATLF